jgi:hypothetical protein
VFTIPAAASVAVTRAGPLLRLCALAGALAVAGCGAGGLASPAAPSAGGGPAVAPAASPAAASPAASVGSTATPAATPVPTEQPGPPAATLVVGGGAPAAGALGSYVWDGAGSDAPWLVPPAAAGVRARGPYAVMLVPPLPVDRWEAAWARVDDGSAGSPEGAVSGDAGPVSVPGPGAPSTWSLMVEIRFADGNHAAWYWRVDVLP